ncbi:MAG: sulfotransferase [Chloroflexota bacterium]
MFKLFGIEPEKIIKASLEKGKVYRPFQYFSEQNETIFQIIFDDSQFEFDLFYHFDHFGQLLGKTAMGSAPAEFWASHHIPQLFEKLESADKAHDSFENLLRRMHFAAGNADRSWEQTKEVSALNQLFSAPPIIIGGCGRSGTSLLLSVLGAHSSILSLETETYAFYPHPFRINRILNQIEKQPIKESAHRWCEKTPKNVQSFGQIQDFFKGNVKLIHIVRDGRAVVTSHHPNHAQTYWVPLERWISDVEEGLKFKDITHIVRYEDLVSDPLKTLQRLCKFIEEPFDQRMMEFHKHTNVQKNIAWGLGTNVEPLTTNHTQKWKAEEHTEVINNLMGNKQAIGLLSKLGYLEKS